MLMPDAEVGGRDVVVQFHDGGLKCFSWHTLKLKHVELNKTLVSGTRCYCKIHTTHCDKVLAHTKVLLPLTRYYW